MPVTIAAQPWRGAHVVARSVVLRYTTMRDCEQHHEDEDGGQATGVIYDDYRQGLSTIQCDHMHQHRPNVNGTIKLRFKLLRMYQMLRVQDRM
jgi:hypothetical protein